MSQSSVATHLTFSGIFSDSITKSVVCCPDSDSEKSLKLGQYWMTLRRTVFGPPCIGLP